jgi:hypothetical protein
MKRLYLDVCTYCRPFDNQNALRIRLETDAFYLIMKHIKEDKYQTVLSPVHFKEINAIPSSKKRFEIQTLLVQNDKPIYDIDKARQRADELHTLKFGIADAAHLAYAEQMADLFITCDDKLLKKCQKTSLSIMTMNPIEFVLSEGLQ